MNGFAALPLLLPLGRGDVLETLGDLLKHHLLDQSQNTKTLYIGLGIAAIFSYSECLVCVLEIVKLIDTFSK